jgi:Na+-translocating ferredoxin:NAD+ oxidoreductase RnfC subunit
LHVLNYDLPAPYLHKEISPQRLTLPLKQSAGAPALAKVRLGDRVQAGQVIAEPTANALGAILHAPHAGVITAVTDKQIVLEK